MDIEELVSKEESLSREILDKVSELIDVNNDIHKESKFDPDLRLIGIFSHAKIRILLGLRNVINRKQKYRTLLSAIEEGRQEEKRWQERREKRERRRSKEKS